MGCVRYTVSGWASSPRCRARPSCHRRGSTPQGGREAELVHYWRWPDYCNNSNMKGTMWDEMMDAAAEGVKNGEKVLAPPSERSKGPIGEMLKKYLPEATLPRGEGSVIKVLEVASGTGQHAAHFSSLLPSADWQPSDNDPRSAPVVGAFTSGAMNVLPLEVVDAMEPDSWPFDNGSFQAVFCANMIHVAPYLAMEGLIAGAGRVCPPKAKLLIYGPFKVGGVASPESNARFDESLRLANPIFGLRDLEDIMEKAKAGGFRFVAKEDMPANNYFCVWEKVENS
ncbi:unnamed protein product [Discosporangium mesarthrocarpum]